MGKCNGQMVRRLLRATAAAVFLLAAGIPVTPVQVRAEFFRYVDKEGKIHYVDDIARIPPEYREDLKRYEESSDHLTESEKSALLEEERRKAEESSRVKEKDPQEAIKEEEKGSGSSDRTTKVSINGNHVLVPVKLTYGIRETTAMLVLDTGAEVTMIHRPIADRLNLRSIRKATVKVAGGKKVPVAIARLVSVQAGPHTKQEIDVLVMAPEGKLHYDGLLGMNFLKGLDYRIDFENQLIHWGK